MKPGDLLQVDSTVAWARGIWKDPSRELLDEPVFIPGGAMVLLIDDADVRFDDCYNVLWGGRVVVVERALMRPAGGVV